jgi:hypothetical protein
MTYTVTADILDHIIKEAGEYPDGRPKSVEELHEGDTSDFADVDADRIEVLKEAGAIVDTAELQSAKKEQETQAEQAQPPAKQGGAKEAPA